MKNKHGFTIIEVIIALSILLILLATGAPVVAASFKRTNILNAVQATATSAKRAEFLARRDGPTMPWGIRVQTGFVTIFQGASYVTRNTTKDEVTVLPSTVIVSGTAEYLFTWNNTLNSTTGTTTFTTTGIAKTVNLNAIGTVTY